MGLKIEAARKEASKAAETAARVILGEKLAALWGQNIHPEELRAVNLAWDKPSISGRRKAFDMMRVISPSFYPEFLAEQSIIAGSEFRENFDEKAGGFCDARGYPPSLYATENALGVVGHFGMVSELLGWKRVRQIVDFVKGSQDKSGGFSHSPDCLKDGGRASMWNTRLAMSIFSDLGHAKDVAGNVLDFVMECIQVDMQKGTGFKEAPSEERASTEATVSALSVFEKIGADRWGWMNNKGLAKFFNSCWQDDGKGAGGFGHVPGAEPALLYTNAVLSTLDTLGVDIDALLPDAADRAQLIAFYEQQTESAVKDALMFGFKPRWTPNSHIMRETMMTLAPLAQKHADFAALWNRIYGDTEKVIRGIHPFSDYVR